MDTIDYSNLNRQFLFRAVHVNRSKVEVARETVLSFPHDAGTTIAAHHGNVKTAKFDLDYFRQFSIVLNALDNIDARRHVNRVCLAVGVPLVESGTEGYLGQVTVIRKGESECYECQPKSDAKKTYPICTVRNHPDKPVHCIAWAKELLFKKLFAGEETDLVDNTEAAAPAAADGEASGAAAPAAAPKLELQPGEDARAFAARVFAAVFEADVARLLSMSTLWKERAPPTPLDLRALVPDLAAVDIRSPEADQAVWSTAESARAFVGAIVRAFESRRVRVGELAFDKDDVECLDFVTAASNLRSAVFNIPAQSRFVVKEIAGNIIPAIATTNAIIAGYIALEALKALRANGSVRECGSAFLCRALSGKRKDRLVVTSKLLPPNPGCFVCGTASVTVELDMRTASAELLVKTVLGAKLSFHEPNLREGAPPRAPAAARLACARARVLLTPPLRHPAGLAPASAAPAGARVLYECGGGLDDEEVALEEAKLRKLLCEPPFNLRSGSMLDVDDQSQALNCQIILQHNEQIEPDAHPLGFIVHGALSAPLPPQPAAAGGSGGAGGSAEAAVDDDDFEIVEAPPLAAAGSGAAGEKRAKTSAN